MICPDCNVEMESTSYDVGDEHFIDYQCGICGSEDSEVFEIDHSGGDGRWDGDDTVPGVARCDACDLIFNDHDLTNGLCSTCYGEEWMVCGSCDDYYMRADSPSESYCKECLVKAGEEA